MAEKLFTSDEPKSTAYCTVLREGGFEWEDRGVKKVVQKIRINKTNEQLLRFGYYGPTGFVPRPMEIPEENLPALLDGAIQGGAISPATVAQLKALLAKY